MGWCPASRELQGFLSAFVSTWRHLEACRGLAPSKTPLFLRELLTSHLFVFGGAWGAGKGGVTDREPRPCLQQLPPASSAEERSFLLLLKPGKGWGFSASPPHCCFLCPRPVGWSSELRARTWRGQCISRTWYSQPQRPSEMTPARQAVPKLV